MQSLTSDNSGLNKLKSIFFLGLSCNRTTLFGCLLVWIALCRNELSSTYENFIFLVCVVPFFMGDAVNYYVLGRIRLEEQNGWDDIRLTEDYKKRISKFYYIYRAISIIASYSTVALMFILSLKLIQVPEIYAELLQWLIPLGIVAMFINFALALQTMLRGILPVLPDDKKHGLFLRITFVIIAFSTWLTYITNNSVLDYFGNFFVFITGILYFIICGLIHPLPAKGSLFGAILRESIISQSEAVVRADRENQIMNYSSKPEDIEDASIVSTNNSIQDPDINKKAINDNKITDAVISDASISEKIDSEKSGEAPN